VKGLITPVASVIFVLAFADAGDAQARKLSDSELDRVTAGGVSSPTQTAPAPPSISPFTFEFKSLAGTRHTVEGTGSVQVVEQEGGGTRSTLVIQDRAQQNLQSFINVTAVNSRIQVLVNLNITINSTVGTIQQLNASTGP
jgi:hypothetical protein